MFQRLTISALVLCASVSSVAVVATQIFGATSVVAQQVSVAQVVAQVVAQSGEDPVALFNALLPILAARPSRAAEVISIASTASPGLASALAQALYSAQVTIGQANPGAAQVIAGIVATAPTSFQASYAASSIGGAGTGTQGASLGTFGSSTGVQPVSGTTP